MPAGYLRRWLIPALYYLGDLCPGGGKGARRLGNFREMDKGKKRSTEEALLVGRESLSRNSCEQITGFRYKLGCQGECIV